MLSWIWALHADPGNTDSNFTPAGASVAGGGCNNVKNKLMLL